MPPVSEPKPSRREQTRLAVRQRIMEEGRQLFAQKGYEAATMRDVAKATEYTPSALYYHFKDKAALMQAICSEDFLELSTRFQGALTSPDPLENIKRIGLAYARFALEHPNHYRLMFMTPHPHELSAEDELRKGDPNEDAYAGLHHLVTLALEQGLLRPELNDAHLVAQTYWAGIHGMVALELDKGCEHWIPWADVTVRIETMCDVLRLGFQRP